MGAVFGRIGQETPPYTVVQAAGAGEFEVRDYQQQLVVTTDIKSFHNSGEFGLLARYIGVMSEPQNESVNNPGKSEAISMTSPVILDNSYAAAKRGDKMSFILPNSKYKTLDQVPKPTDPRVRVEEIPAKTVAVKTFTWALGEQNIRSNRDYLLASLNDDDEWKVVLQNDGTPTYHVAAYNSPFTLPFMRTNEVHVVVERKDKGQNTDSVEPPRMDGKL